MTRRMRFLTLGVWAFGGLLACVSEQKGETLLIGNDLPDSCRAYAETMSRCFNTDVGNETARAFSQASTDKTKDELQALSDQCEMQNTRSKALCR